ncbi:DUF3263 domain-containing protein [Propionibacteriaceae bacterium Y2011]
MTDIDRRIIETCHLPRPQRQRVSDDLQIRTDEYHLRLAKLIDDPEALRKYPGVVGRLRRIRDDRRAARSLRSVSWG